jgi:hypothetical protein
VSKSRKRRVVKGLLAFDFDGVLHSKVHYSATWGELDFTGLTKAQKRGWAVGVMTCNDVHRVAALLVRAGFKVFADRGMTQMFWDGGDDGLTVIVTNRKLAASRYLDDKGQNFQFGQDWDEALDAAEAAISGAKEWEEVAV